VTMRLGQLISNRNVFDAVVVWIVRSWLPTNKLTLNKTVF